MHCRACTFVQWYVRLGAPFLGEAIRGDLSDFMVWALRCVQSLSNVAEKGVLMRSRCIVEPMTWVHVRSHVAYAHGAGVRSHVCGYARVCMRSRVHVCVCGCALAGERMRMRVHVRLCACVRVRVRMRVRMRVRVGARVRVRVRVCAGACTYVYA